MNCTLCTTPLTDRIDESYFDCPVCRGLVRDLRFYPDRDEEKAQYLAHNNDVNDPRYQKFVSPITNYILQNFNAGHQGLDFGSGTGPVISKMLLDEGYDIVQYDPYFANHPQLLERRYDYVVACEVVEHFYDPLKEFQKLHGLLKEGGTLACMTLLYHEKVDFETWHYRKDPTHVFIYRAETFRYIAEQLDFSGVHIQDRLITLKK